MITYLVQLIFSLLPDTRLYGLKRSLLRLRGFEIGENVRVVSSVKIKLQKLSIGDNSFIGHDTLIASGNARVTIGRNVDIAPRCLLIGGTHEIGDSSQRAGRGVAFDITIGDGTWIGTHSTILGGVSVGKGCVVGACSLVRDDIEPNCLVGGVPAQVLRKLSQTEL